MRDPTSTQIHHGPATGAAHLIVTRKMKPKCIALKYFHKSFNTTLPVTHDEAKEKEILSKVQFGPTLSPSEREEMQCLVKAYMSLFVTKYVDLPTITIEEHKIELVEGARPVRCKQQRLSPQQADILKRELDQLLAGRFIEPVDNAQWISPVTIVPKKNGKWRVCVNYKALNKVTKKTDILYHL
jgi:hypothetical protein